MSDLDRDNRVPRTLRGRTHIITLVIVTLLIIGPGAYGFLDKLIQFAWTIRNDPYGNFTMVPLSNYMIVAFGMTCMLIWATAHGMFRDVERPKFTMLEQEEEIERASGGR